MALHDVEEEEEEKETPARFANLLCRYMTWFAGEERTCCC